MDRETGFDIGLETGQLLARLDEAIDRSCLLRDVLQQRQRLAAIEETVGNCSISRQLRAKIDQLEQNLPLIAAKESNQAS